MKPDVREELADTRDAQAETPSQMRLEMPPWQRPTITKIPLSMTLGGVSSGADTGQGSLQ